MYVVKFEDLGKSDIGIAGGKGANLGELTQAGIPVPPGFVVTAETYGKFMEDAGINGKVLDILAKTDINNTKELQAAAEEIKSIIIGTPVPEDMSTLIIEAYNQLCQRVDCSQPRSAGLVAPRVRPVSSGTGCDCRCGQKGTNSACLLRCRARVSRHDPRWHSGRCRHAAAVSDG